MSSSHTENEREDTSRKIQLNGSNAKPAAQTAVMPVSKYSRYYKMNHKKRRIAYIFNHRNFKYCHERHGTNEDVEKLKKCLGDLHFEVLFFNDLKLKQFETQIKKATEVDYSDYDCFMLVVLSHGVSDILNASDKAYNPSLVIFDKFTAEKCPTLAGKPKIFILQACQGDSTDPGIWLVARGTEFDGGRTPYRIPIKADFLIIYATSKGYYAFCNEGTGSYFISVLCEELNNLAHKEHLLDILTFVNQRVAIEFESNNHEDLEKDDRKQMPYFQSSLTRFIHFGNIESQIQDPTFISTRTKK